MQINNISTNNNICFGLIEVITISIISHYDSVLSLANPVHILIPCSCKINFHIILPCTTVSLTALTG